VASRPVDRCCRRHFLTKLGLPSVNGHPLCSRDTFVLRPMSRTCTGMLVRGG
jgi:hypothetical protein